MTVAEIEWSIRGLALLAGAVLLFPNRATAQEEKPMRRTSIVMLSLAIVCLFSAVAFAQGAADVAVDADMPAWLVAVVQIAVALSGAIVALLSFLKTRVGKGLTSSIENDAAAKASAFASGVAFDIVAHGFETLVKPAKAALADGKITQEELDGLLRRTKLEAMLKLKELTLGRLIGSGAAASEAIALEMLDHKIEAVLPAVKANPLRPSA